MKHDRGKLINANYWVMDNWTIVEIN